MGVLRRALAPRVGRARDSSGLSLAGSWALKMAPARAQDATATSGYKEAGMGRWSADRWAATSGIVFVALFIVSFFTATKPPDSTDPNSQWVTYFVDHHRATLISAVLLGAAIVFFIWFAGSVAAALRNAGEQRLAAVAFGGGVATAAAAIVIAGLQGGLAYRIAIDSPANVKAFVDFSYSVQTLISFPVAVLIGATAIASWRSGAFPRWWAQLSGLAAIVMVSGGGALAHSGFYRPDGPWAFVTLINFLVWTLVTSGWLVMRTHAEATPKAAAAAV
jgi:hypothetical protein